MWFLFFQPLPELTGEFSGKTASGKDVSLKITQRGQGITGFGTIGSRPFNVSGLASIHAPTILEFQDRRIGSANIKLSADSENLTLKFPSETITIERSSSSHHVEPGVLTGKYQCTADKSIQVLLSHSGKMIAGTGVVNDSPVAVTGKLTSDREGRGTILYSDTSSNAIRFSVSEDFKKITVYGLGNPLVMRKL